MMALKSVVVPAGAFFAVVLVAWRGVPALVDAHALAAVEMQPLPRTLYTEHDSYGKEGLMIKQGYVHGHEHTCELTSGGYVFCWGDNTMGQLGYGDTRPRMRAECDAVNVGCASLGPSTSGGCVNGIAAGAFHTCVMLEGGGLKCWGQNDDGQLGYGDHFSRGDAPDEMGEMLQFVSVGATAVSIECGQDHTCVDAKKCENCDLITKCWGQCPKSTADGITELPSRGCETFHRMPPAAGSSAAVLVMLGAFL